MKMKQEKNNSTFNEDNWTIKDGYCTACNSKEDTTQSLSDKIESRVFDNGNDVDVLFPKDVKEAVKELKEEIKEIFEAELLGKMTNAGRIYRKLIKEIDKLFGDDLI